MLRRLLTLLLALLLPLCAQAEIIFEDAIVEGEAYDGVNWDFPVALTDMDPAFVMLANKEMLLPSGYTTKPLVKMKTRKANKDGSNANGGVLKAPKAGELQLNKTCAEAYVQMCEDARAEGINLYLKSAYRSYKTQKTMYNNRLKKNNGRDDGWVSRPGASDHQTGLGLDVLDKAWSTKSAMNAKFAATEAAQWMAANCARYGFVIRYPEDKTEVTGINYEPWHLRYVGVPAATYIMDNGLCLEEFCEQLWAACRQFIDEGGDASLVQPFLQESAVNK